MSGEESAHPTRRQVIVGATLLGAGATVGSSLLAACGSDTTSKGTKTDKRHQTLYVAGEAWGPITTFNPFNGSATWPFGNNQTPLTYEQLFGYNNLDGSLKPALAASLDMPDDKTIVVKMQPAAKWQDGQAVTADDVVFTFEIAKRHEEAPWNSFWQYVTSVTATDPQTVTFALDPKAPNPGMVKTNFVQVPILPKHLWADIEAKNAKLTEYTNQDPLPVGSGPYKLEKWDQTQLVWVRDENYWGKAVHGKLPAPKWVIHPIFKDNAAGSLAFEQGNVDYSQQFTPQLWKLWEDKKLPVGTWFDKPPYHLPGSIPMLVINTTKPGLNNPTVRRAMAHAIDYANIAKTAMSDYSIPAKSSVIIPQGAEQQYFDQANVDANGWTFDLAKCKQIMEEELKATKGSDGIYKLPDGTRMGPWKAQTPNGWSDWQAALDIVAPNLKAAGFDVSTSYPEAPQVTDSVHNADFDMALFYIAGAGPASPWQRFRDVLDIRGVAKPGQPAYYNYGRFSDPAVPALLDKSATATGAEAKDLFTKLDTIYMKNAPMIPLMYRPSEFYEFNATYWTGFPTSAHPTAPPQFTGAGIQWMYDITAK